MPTVVIKHILVDKIQTIILAIWFYIWVTLMFNKSLETVLYNNEFSQLTFGHARNDPMYASLHNSGNTQAHIVLYIH